MSRGSTGATPAPITVAVAACPVCEALGGEVLYSGLRDRVFAVAPGGWTLRHCAGCGAARLDPRPADAELGALYARYYTHAPPSPNLAPTGAAGALRALRNAHLNVRLGYRLAPAWAPGRVVGRLVPPLAALAERGVRSLPLGDRLLDVGAGNGTFVAEAAAAGWRASGIDLDPAAVGAARAAGLDVTFETIGARAAREPGTYDAVTLNHVVEHVADPVAFLRAARTLLRDGGRLWLATPNLDAAGHRAFGPAWMHLDPPRHLVLFDAGSLRRALTAAGFGTVALLRPTPAAARSYRVSAAVRAGRCPAHDAPLPGPALGLRAAAADARAQFVRSRGEELLALAR